LAEDVMSITLEKNLIETENNILDKTSLEGIRKVISKEYFKPNTGFALIYTFAGVVFYLFSLLILAYTYIHNIYWAWPFAYFLAGTAVTSFFVLGHDCGHQSFLKNNKLNDILGHLFFIAPMYPYYGWKFSHNAHHKHTNKLVVNSNDIYYDNAWIPLTIDRYKQLKKNNSFFAFLYKLSRYFPPIGSFFHNIITHFIPSKFNESQRKKVVLSQLILAISIISILSFSITASALSALSNRRAYN
jgi:omega-6 fatty acid desaturase (delta-12 desaturase)